MCEARGEVAASSQAKTVSVSCWGHDGGGELALSMEGFRRSSGLPEGSLVTFDNARFETYTPRCMKHCAAKALDIVLAVDVSGSTREGAVDAAIEVVRQLDLSRVSLSLMTFSDEPTIEINFDSLANQECSDASAIELEAVARQAGLSATEGCAALVAAAPIFCAFPVGGLAPLALYCEESCGRCSAGSNHDGAVNAAEVKGRLLDRLDRIRQLKSPNRKTNIGKALQSIATNALTKARGWREDAAATRVLVISDGLTNGDGENASSFAAAKLELTMLGVDLFSLLVPADPFSRFSSMQELDGLDVGDQLSSYFGQVRKLGTYHLCVYCLKEPP